MKQWIQTLLLLVMIIPAVQTIKAQQQEPPSQYARPVWVPDNGYWVTETTRSNSHHTIIRYYLDNNRLIYTESIDGRTLNTNKDKVKMQLKQHLQQAVTAWENGHPLQDTAKLAWNVSGKKNILHAAPGSR